MENKQFNINDFESGKFDVVTRRGLEVEIITTKGRVGYEVIAYVGKDNMPNLYSSAGLIEDDFASSNDLFLVEKQVSDNESDLLSLENDIEVVGKCANCAIEYHIHANKES